MVTKTAEKSTEMTQPVIIDLGAQKSSAIKDLKAGEGELWGEVFDVIDEVKDMLGAEADGKVLIPVVMLYQKKQRRLDLDRILFPLLDRDDDDDDDDDEDDEE